MMNEQPKILILDIETSPIIASTWGPKYETNIIEVIEDSQIICFSAKWYGGKQITKGLIDYEGYKAGVVDDSKIIKDIHQLLDEADVTVTQNGVSFDHKVINSRFIANDMLPPAPYKMIDTLSEAKRYLKLPSYSLNDMCTYFGIGQKLQHEGFKLWKDCIAGDAKAWKTMKKYNAQDVKLTEEFYLRLRPFMRTHPNFSVYADKNNCPKCGSSKVQARGFTATSTMMYRRAQCMACGGWFRFGKKVLRIENTRTNL